MHMIMVVKHVYPVGCAALACATQTFDSKARKRKD